MNKIYHRMEINDLRQFLHNTYSDDDPFKVLSKIINYHF